MAKVLFQDGRQFALVCKSLDGEYTTAEARFDYSNYASSSTPATTGTMSLTMNAYDVYTITPTGACTFNATGGVPGQRCSIVVTTSGVSSYNLTFNTNFTSAGVLATGTANGKTFAITFVTPNGTKWIEIGRTAAM
jgi:uncharacterized protein (DUF2126 family)